MTLYCSKDYFLRPLSFHCVLKPRLLLKISRPKFSKSIVPNNRKSHEGILNVFPD